MLSRRPYLIRALFDWLLDSGETPHLLVDATVAGAELPEGYVQEGRMVLNVGPAAVQHLKLGNDEISFSARFGGTPRQLRFPPSAVIAIYGRDSGQGMMFGPETDGPDDNAPGPGGAADDSSPRQASGRPSLKVIK